MSDEEYEIIFVPNEGRAVLDKKTKKIYYSEFQIIEEKNEQLNKYKQVIDKIKDICLENMYVDDRGGEPEKVERDIRPSKILELLEEIE